MDAARENSVDTVIHSLVDGEPIKVWSWLTTIFGDMAQQEGDELSGSVLGALTESIGIRPQAMRVALHRLRKDGWIVARKEGRNSFYRLTESALVETHAASARIYAAQVNSVDDWYLLVTAGPSTDLAIIQTQLRDGSLVKIADSTFLGFGSRPDVDEAVINLDIRFEDIPDWVVQKVATVEITDAYVRLETLLNAIETQGDPITVLQRTTLRLLTLHHWRRTVLRCPAIVEMLAGEGWIGATCRQRSIQLLDTLHRPDVSIDF